MNTGAVIAAAGMSSRMKAFKPLLEIGGRSVAERIVDTFRQAGVFPIVMVTGRCARELEAHLGESGVLFVHNENYAATQMFDSARIGLEFIRGMCVRTFFTPIDVPLFTGETLGALMECGADIAIPSCGKRAGHPILISFAVLPGLLSRSGEGGLRAGMKHFAQETAFVEVTDRGVLLDADTPGDFAALLEYEKAKRRP